MIKEKTSYQALKIGNTSVIFKETFGHNESSSKFTFMSAIITSNLLQDTFKVIKILMVVPLDRATADKDTLLKRKVASLVGYDKITTLRKGRDD